MDTNLKESKKNKLIATTLGVLLITLILAVISVAVYVPIKDALFKDDIQRYLKSRDFAYTLSDLTYYVGQNQVAQEDGYSTQYDDLENIKYYIKDQNNQPVASNIKANSLQTEIDNSQFYLQITTDAEGNPSIKSAPTWFDKRNFINTLNHYTPDNSINYLANLEITYTVPKELTNNNDLFINNMKRHNTEQYLVLILIIGGVSIFILTVAAFAFPYSSQKRAAIVELFNRMFLEAKFLTWLGFFWLCVAILELMSGYYYDGINLFNLIYDANAHFYLIGIPLTWLLCTLIYLSICYVKHIYFSGIKEGLIRNSLAGRLLLYLVAVTKKTVNQILALDITTDNNRQLLKLLGLNLIVLFIIALTHGFGLIVALAYTALLFKYGLKILDKTKNLNQASSQLAKGDFDVVLPEDMGILSPFAKSLNNIKDGFKVAVEKEIKSQNMKTQLISNVSHDLKTPLTSIITYVDLLKNEDLDEETKKQYLDVLDQKSKRLKVLIEDLFEASKASSGNIELHLESVDAIALLRQTLGEMEEKINESSLQMKINLPENKVICQLDGARTYRVFENIIGNILKYAMPNTRVYIDAEEDEKEARFIFKNISAYEMNFDPAEITERSFRGDKSRNTEGSGLGLAIAKSLVDLQNGKLDINIDGDLFKLTVTFPKA